MPRYVLLGYFQTIGDDKSGYQHVLLHPSSFILRLKLTSSFVHSRLDGKLACPSTINSDSQFQATRGLLGSRFRNTLMIDTLDSFLFLHFGLAGALLLSEHKQPLISCVISSLRLDISSLLENGSWFLQHGLVF